MRITSGGTPSRRAPEFFIGGTIPWVKTQELLDGWIDDTEEHITLDAVKNSSAKILPEQTVLVAMYGATVGQLGMLRRPMSCNQACCAFIVDKSKADFRYLYYQLLNHRHQLKELSTGAAQQNLSGTMLKAYQLPFPKVETQGRIADVLASLDNKIELNRRMNETLEAMARALFRSWFVDFDPVRAKSEGRPTGLPADLDTLFPSEFEDSPLGEIPKGWSVRPLDEIADFLNGLALQKFPAVEGEPWLPVIKIAQLRKGITSDCDRASYGVPPNYIIQNGDLLFSWSGSLEVQVWTHGQGALNQHLFKVTSKEFQQWFVYQWLMEHLTHFRHVAASKATTMGHIQRSHLTGALCVVPDERVLSAANDQVGPLHAQVVQNSLEASRLASTRDELLPRLLSGEIEIAGEEVVIG